MKTSTEGSQQRYNAQAAVDGESRLILAVNVTGKSSDVGEMENMIAGAHQNTGSDPGVFVADAGCTDEQVFKDLADAGVDPYLPQGREF